MENPEKMTGNTTPPSVILLPPTTFNLVAPPILISPPTSGSGNPIQLNPPPQFKLNFTPTIQLGQNLQLVQPIKVNNFVLEAPPMLNTTAAFP